MNALAPPPATQLDLGFVRRGDRTVLDRRLFSWPFVITRTFLLDAVPAHLLTVILQTSSGAIHGEDLLRQRLYLDAGAAVHFATQGATAIHRAHLGMTSGEAVKLTVGADALLEYVPEPRILFPGAALHQTIDLDCAPTATAIVSDAFTLHDPEGSARGFRQFDSTMTLRYSGGEPVLIDRLDISHLGRGPTRQFSAFGNMVMVLPLPEEQLEALALQLSAALDKTPGVYAAASVLPASAGIGIRLAGHDLRALRAGMELAWMRFRIQVCCQPPARRWGR